MEYEQSFNAALVQLKRVALRPVLFSWNRLHVLSLEQNK